MQIEYKIEFRPMQAATHQLMIDVYETEELDPVATYSRLISATLMAGCMIGLSSEQMIEHVKKFAPNARECFEKFPKVFGPKNK